MFDEREIRTPEASLDADEDLDDGDLDEPFEDDFAGDEDDYEAVDVGANGGFASDSPKEDLRRLVHYLATNLVDEPENVVVEAVQRGQIVSLTLRVPEHELGKVIGRQGRIARAIRTILTIASARHNLRASLDIEG